MFATIFEYMFTATDPQALTAYAAANPNAVAVSAADTELTYAELDSWSNRLARVLIATGARPGASVAVAVSRSVELMVVTWAVAKAGATMAGSAAESVLAVTTKSDRTQVADVADVLLLDDLSTMRRYMTVSDAAVTAADFDMAA